MKNYLSMGTFQAGSFWRLTRGVYPSLFAVYGIEFGELISASVPRYHANVGSRWCGN